jgi:hypothetical protein
VSDRQFHSYYSARARLRSGHTSPTTVANAIHDFTREVEPDPVAHAEWMAQLKPMRYPLDDSNEFPSDDDPASSSPQSHDQQHRSNANHSTSTTDVSSHSQLDSTSPHGDSSIPTDTRFSVGRPPPVHPMSRRSLRNLSASSVILSPDTHGDYLDSYGGWIIEQFNISSSTLSVGKVLKSEHSAEWIKAIQSEISQLLTSTLEPVDPSTVSGDYRIIHSTMQLKKKLHQDNSIDKLKARLCACGNELAGMINETFSPTVGALTYATVHQMSIIDRMYKCTVDTVGAYLHQSYPDDAMPLYLTLPANVAEACHLNPKALYRIRKYLYGLPDAGLAYYKAYRKHLESNGYKRSISDPCLFIKIDGNIRTYVFTHVDDTFVCSTHKNQLKIFTDALRTQFEITVVDNVEEYLGIKITQLPSGDVQLTQPKLLSSMIEEHSALLHNFPRRKPFSAPQRIVDTALVESSTPIDITKYLHLLGGLIYLTKSRPDIMTAVSFAATYAAKPTEKAYTELLYILAYLADTRTYGLILHAGIANRPLVLTCYVDASYLTHRDSHSHSGYCLSLGTVGIFYAKSGKQTLVATSSTHAELRALHLLVVDIIFVIHLCSELGRPLSLPCVIMEDNQPVIDLTKDVSTRSKRCKHFLMLVHFIKEQVEHGLISLQKVNTLDNLADLLTKIVTGSEYITKADLLLGRSSVTPKSRNSISI